MRKKQGLDVSTLVTLKIATDAEFAAVVEQFKDEIIANTSSSDVIITVGQPSEFKAEAKFEGKVAWLDY